MVISGFWVWEYVGGKDLNVDIEHQIELIGRKNIDTRPPTSRCYVRGVVSELIARCNSKRVPGENVQR